VQVLLGPVQFDAVTWDAGTVTTTLSLVGVPPDSSVKFTLEPGKNPVPVMVTVAPPAMEVVVGEMEVTTGTVGLHCQLT
jgi:hypothetical protein